MNSQNMREAFLNFFKKNSHTVVSSSPLIPANDPTLLFANAGMNQFKDVFVGKEKRAYSRATSAQKCIRAGGKHNDLENVGFTARHLTFFEMLGNFSFGDYFKKEAIEYAWTFLTKDLKFDASKLYVSVHLNDQESYDLWHDVIGIPYERIVRLGDADNFWQMGDTGPCGPCTEIYVDRGEAYGTGPDNSGPGSSGDRFIEIWNLVFMQYDRQADGTLVPLARTGVDTGMGFERLCMVMQQKDTIFDTDIFEPFFKAIGQVYGRSYEECSEKEKVAFRVIGDHVRSSVFALADGADASNEGRGYVIRKIIRRATLFAQKLSGPESVFKAVDVCINTYKNIFPEVWAQRNRIQTIIKHEVERFEANLSSGTVLFAKYARSLKKGDTIGGKEAFVLYDTYGFPLELTKLLAHEHDLKVDLEGFEHAMEQQRALSSGKQKQKNVPTNDQGIITKFVGYDVLHTQATIKALLIDVDGVFESVQEVPEHTSCWALVDQTCFYAECGGQVQDRGEVIIGKEKFALDSIIKVGNAYALSLTLPIALKVGLNIDQRIDQEYRLAIARNHTATHLLQSALFDELGGEIKQAGSFVCAEYLRFDFTYHEHVSQQQIEDVEKLVTRAICANHAVSICETSLAEATKKGAKAFFGEKYNPEAVRVVCVSDVSAELCGGTHVRHTGDIGSFKIIESSALSAGVRRIVAVTGTVALEKIQHMYATQKALSLLLKTDMDSVGDACQKLHTLAQDQNKTINGLAKTILELKINEEIVSACNGAYGPYAIVNLGATDPKVFTENSAMIAAKATQTTIVLVTAAGSKGNFMMVVPQDKIELAQTITKKLAERGIKCGGQKCQVQGGFSLEAYSVEAFVRIMDDVLKK